MSAAASLVDVLPKVAAEWKRSGGMEVQFNFDASSRLATQIANGAPVDLFFSADEEWMDVLAGQQLLEPNSRADLLTNELVLVVPTASKLQVTAAADLRSFPLRRLALAAENVPAGKYARKALASLGAWNVLQSKVVNGANVRQTLQLAATGEADAAIVYRTDALADPKVRIAFTFPADSHPRIVYPVAVMRDSAAKGDARRFLQFCQGAAAQKFFQSAGFGFVLVK